MKTYHYSAFAQKENGDFIFIHGTLQKSEITSDEYKKIVEFIGKQMNPPQSPDAVMVISLTVIG